MKNKRQCLLFLPPAGTRMPPAGAPSLPTSYTTPYHPHSPFIYPHYSLYFSSHKPTSSTTYPSLLRKKFDHLNKMGVSSNGSLLASVLVLVVALTLSSSAFGGNFYQDFEVTFGDGRVKRYGSGQVLSLSLDKVSGSGFRSKKEYLFGRIDMQLKLVAGNSAGTVTAYYLSSQGPTHDEIDFEFLGNVSGQPYTLHTNVFTQGKGDREQQFHLWFDPTKNFHTYSVLWNPRMIVFLVDNTPIRVFKNHEAMGVPFPKKQPMRIYSSLWNADQWATQGGLVKTDWSKAPFTAYYRSFNANPNHVAATAAFTGGAWQTQELNAWSRRRLRWVQKYFMIYNYCTDFKRFPQGVPLECRR